MSESLKINKEVNGLAEFVGGRIMECLDTIEKQTVTQLVEMLKDKYGRTRSEEVEELIKEWMEFKPNDYEKEDEYLFAMERLFARKEEKQIEDREWFSEEMRERVIPEIKARKYSRDVLLIGVKNA